MTPATADDRSGAPSQDVSGEPAPGAVGQPTPAVLLHHPSSLRHETGAHPEQPARIAAIERELEARALPGW